MDPDYTSMKNGVDLRENLGLAVDAATVAYPFVRAFSWLKGMLFADAMIANPVPQTFGRVIPQGLNPTTLAKPGDIDVFVTNATALRGLSNAQIAQKLTIPEIPGGFKIIEFPSSSIQGIASPVFRANPGFIQGGRTAGGLPEFVIPNGPIPAGATQWIPHK